MKKLLCIDGNSILNRSFYGIRLLTTKDGFPTNALYGLVGVISRELETLKDYDDTCDPREHTDRTIGKLYINADGLHRLASLMVNGGIIGEAVWFELPEGLSATLSDGGGVRPLVSGEGCSEAGTYVLTVDERVGDVIYRGKLNFRILPVQSTPAPQEPSGGSSGGTPPSKPGN